MKILQIQMLKEFHVMNVIYYTEINLLCIVILFLIRSPLHRHKTGLYSTARMIFNWLLWAAVLLCASDLVAGVCRGRGGSVFVLYLKSVICFSMKLWR